MALKGNLRDFSTTQLLNLISLARKTGTLTIEGTEMAQMSFREGKLIHATMGSNSNNLASEKAPVANRYIRELPFPLFNAR